MINGARSERVLVRWLYRHAITRGDAPAWIDSVSGTPVRGTPVCWRSLAAAALAGAERLRAAGIRPGRSVVTCLANGRAAVWGSLALQAAAAVEVPRGADADAAQVLQHMQRVGASFCLHDHHRDDLRALLGPRSLTLEPLWRQTALSIEPHQLERALQASEQTDPTGAALILRTSGTTSAPREVVLSWHALASNAAGKLAAARQDEHDVRLTVLPLAHAYARTCDLGTWLISGGVLAATSGWQGLCEAAPHVRPTVMNLVPSLAQRLLTATAPNDATTESARQQLARLGLDRLRMLGCGGAALDADDFHGLRRLGITVIQGYGLTEAGPVVCSASPEDARCGSVGRPVAGWRLRADDQRRLWARGPGMMSGYLDDPRSTAEKICHGWLDTGDLAEVDDDGCWRILGRHDDAIVLDSGWKVHPLAIEQRLTRIAGVERAVLFGDGRRLGVIVQLQAHDSRSLSPPQLQSLFDKALADRPKHERPARVVIVPRPLSAAAGELTAKGTVRRTAIVARWSNFTA